MPIESPTKEVEEENDKKVEELTKKLETEATIDSSAKPEQKEEEEEEEPNAGISTELKSLLDPFTNFNN